RDATVTGVQTCALPISKPINSTTLQTFQDMQRARATADLVAGRFRQYDPKNPQGAVIQALAGFAYVLLAEDYCNGVPTSKVNDEIGRASCREGEEESRG